MKIFYKDLKLNCKFTIEDDIILHDPFTHKYSLLSTINLNISISDYLKLKKDIDSDKKINFNLLINKDINDMRAGLWEIKSNVRRFSIISSLGKGDVKVILKISILEKNMLVGRDYNKFVIENLFNK